MAVTLARSMDAVAICTCSLPTAGLPRHLPLTLSLLPRTASPTAGRRRRPGPRHPVPVPPPGAPVPRPPAEVRPLCSVGGRGLEGDRPGGSPPGVAGGSTGGGMCLPGEPEPGGVCSGARREHPAQKAPQKAGVFALARLLGW